MLRAGGGVVALGFGSQYGRLVAAAQALSPGLRRPGSLPDPGRPAGEPTAALPFDHIVVVMMENHSFDNYLGMLPLRGQPRADGFKFDGAGRPVNSNPVKGGYITARRAPSLCTPNDSASQSWNDTHRSINNGRMDGFARLGESSMAYWDEPDLPFYYSLAKTFCLANRWFCSAPAQTYPNRRFLMAGTAFGCISTDTSSITQKPPNGTIFDRLNAHKISWRNYFTDVPATGVIESVPQNNPTHLASIAQFSLDCASGNLPAVSFVDSDIGAASIVAGAFPAPFAPVLGPLNNQNQDEENGDLSLGENFVSGVVQNVLRSPLWPRILLVWLHDEHGGWYDHVPPPAAIPPDSIPPKLGPNDVPGAYNIYGPRVPAVAVSGYAKRHAVTNVVHDHTSVLATIQAKWNLPAMTYRDANARMMADFLHSGVTFPEPPQLAAPSDLPASERTCDTNPMTFAVHGREALHVHVLGVRRGALALTLATSGGTLVALQVELLHRSQPVASAAVQIVGTRPQTVTLRPHHRLKGTYRLVVRSGRATLADQSVTFR